MTEITDIKDNVPDAVQRFVLEWGDRRTFYQAETDLWRLVSRSRLLDRSGKGSRDLS